MIFTGERLSVNDTGGINQARYKFASGFIKNRNVLEFGCAFGYGSLLLAKNGANSVTAIDSDKKAILYAKQNFKHKKIYYKTARIESLKPANKYGVVIAFEIIEHLKEPNILLNHAKLSLKRGGYLIVSTPNRLLSLYDGNKPSNPYHVKEYYPGEFKGLLKKYFKHVELFGIFLKRSKKIGEENVKKSLRWQISSFLTRKRWIRFLVNFLPSTPKRIFTGEHKLFFDADDFVFSQSNPNKAPYLLAVCIL